MASTEDFGGKPNDRVCSNLLFYSPAMDKISSFSSESDAVHTRT